jgi:hypothetical protein
LRVRTEREAGNRVRVTLRNSQLELPPLSAEALSCAPHSLELDGLGVGLFVSRSIIGTPGSSLGERSEGVPGTTFCFSIPN